MTDHEAPDASQAPPAMRRSRAERLAIELVETIALTVVLFLVIQSLIAQPFQVQKYSMERTFEQGQYVLVDRLSHLWSAYQRGQVVVFAQPPAIHDGTEPFIKRVIGVGGDAVEIRVGLVYVNGTALDEPYLYRNDAGVAEPTLTNGGDARWVVPEGDLFVMGDHRQVSEDSRVFGPIPVSSVIGRGVVRYWPLSAFGIVQAPAYAGIAAP